MKIDIKQLESLLQEKKYDEVQKIIIEAVNGPLSDQEKGSILTNFASTYIEIINSINIKYRDALKEAIQGMKAINSEESKVNDEVRVAELKEDLLG